LNDSSTLKLEVSLEFAADFNLVINSKWRDSVAIGSFQDEEMHFSLRVFGCEIQQITSRTDGPGSEESRTMRI